MAKRLGVQRIAENNEYCGETHEHISVENGRRLTKDVPSAVEAITL